jgi:Protein of unknown function (DUF3570)
MAFRKFKQTPPKRSASASLQVLMAAALTLPGLFISTAKAGEDEVSFQHSHYQEGKRDLFNVKSQLNPIEVDTIQGSAKIKLAERLKFAFNYTQDTWSGATPVTTAPLVREGNSPNISGASPKIEAITGVFDKNFNPVKLSNPFDITSPVLGKDTQLVHTLSFASPETRKQGDFKLNYDWDNASVNIGGGLSVEKDYDSRFGSLGGRWDFNRKLTSINANLSYTNSYTHALMNHDSLSYFALEGFYPFSNNVNNVVTGSREDWATHLSLTHILNKKAYANLSVGYTNSSGFLTNPYKGVTFAFVDPKSLRPDGTHLGQYAVLHEKRPDYRNQWTQSLSYVQHIAPLDAALHVDYSFFHDDWGINAHTLDIKWGQPLGSGWTVTPHFRYYSQTAANFYQPVFLSKQGLPGGPILNPDGTENGTYPSRINANTLPNHYSSDHRLSAYGTLSGGVTISKQFAKGLSLEASFEYYSHAGSLKLGGEGEAAYADFNYYMANAGLNVDLAKLASASSSSNPHSDHHHHGHSAHKHQAVPAGVMFDHALHNAGDFMVGYRYMYSDQSGSMLHGDRTAKNSDIIFQGCPGTTCSSAPRFMTMHMHMLDLMYAPTDWLTLMLMPQFVDMAMDMYSLPGAPINPDAHMHTGGHETGGVGDTGMYVIGKLFDKPGHHINLSLGVTAPTGDVNVMLRNTHQQGDQLIHFGMQLGSGTWDFKPSLTYTGELDNWSWGTQLSGTKRLESKNASGFAFGDSFQSSAWGGYNLTPWLSTSIRGVYTLQGSINGEFTAAHPTDGSYDHPSNYGGRFADVGFGVSAIVPDGDLKSNRLSFEWLQPVYTDFNDYQVDRKGALSATWSYMF